ncbi:hypothetical protein ACHWQZ_G000289 [Mnemiopsis leidyi]
MEHCLAICGKRTDCVSVTHRPATSHCWLKNRNFGDRYGPLYGVNSANLPCVGTDQQTFDFFTMVNSEGINVTQGNQSGLLLYKGGTVCDDYFSNNAAEAICKLMNFTSAVEWDNGTYFNIQSNYDIKLDDVKCSSTEWESCSYSEEHNCGHSEDVFLSCSVKERELFVLLDSEQNIVTEEGQLGLLLYKGGTVCDDSFNDNAAAAICGLMNFETAARWTNEESFDIQSNYDINLDNVKCSSTEWESCSYSEEHNCGHSEDVFLSCTGKVASRMPIVNLALNQPAEQYDTHPEHSFASNAVDGNRNGNWQYGHSVSHTNSPDGWWKVTLPKMTQIFYIDIYNRMECCQERLRNARVSVDGILVGLVPQVYGEQKYTIFLNRTGE